MDMSIILALWAVQHLFSWVRLDNRMGNAIQEDSTTFNQMLTEGLVRESNSDKERAAVWALDENSHWLKMAP